ncbi:DASH complex subunit duo1-like protein [Thermochaetoides thermophila DSM 1495]|uniref:DASH complex subunit DUO1 n=1 Tax=Chaetomium thermophilum (strain DSM 1495 / CBS 144.50 / IMI 039719) TaxID=759272 RepID=DUO1_CHATD|nr:DASH complex subunit duo1-like protein [Thermochaetoides thermophila DSM 1495]G0SAN7.1 RecName: Full=DASH complex subunit DUO1; AltName: Full=Outer kinetochore protein DUO1 [Thermochaetoides thermophila DSM 1495]EGS19809.1 DASH complex subunit duo1-like protein [Thermochaetoides thermophila DSM 1495]
MADEMDFYSSDYHNDDAFETPSKPPTSTSGRPKGSGAQGGGGMRFDTEEAREAALRKELEGVRKINEVIEGMIGTLERAKGNMGTVSQTVTNATTLLNTWTRMLSQTEHNQRLILNPEWKGATQDLLELEAEERRRQEEVERRAAEAERRREEARRKAEEEERRRAAAAAAAAAPAGRSVGRGTTRGRVRGSGLTRGASSSASGSETTRTTSGIARGGFGYTRGTARYRGAK